MNTKLVHFLTIDKLRLPGLLYEPVTKTNKIALYLHGNGSSSIFYGEDTNIIAQEFTEAGISYFPFNNRGAHYIKSLKRITPQGEERVTYGTSYELIKECIYDINGAIEYLKTIGYDEFYLIGESTGANKIVVYDKYQKTNPVKKYIMLSGGDDTGLYYSELGKDKFFSLLTKSKQGIDEQKGDELQLIDFNGYSVPYTYKALYDILNPDGDYNTFPFNEAINSLNLSKHTLFKEFSRIKKSSLVMYGSLDEFCYGDVTRCVNILKEYTKGKSNFEFRILQGADHGFNGYEKMLAAQMKNFLLET